jgi:hypothetical protein
VRANRIIFEHILQGLPHLLTDMPDSSQELGSRELRLPVGYPVGPALFRGIGSHGARIANTSVTSTDGAGDSGLSPHGRRAMGWGPGLSRPEEERGYPVDSWHHR